MNKEKIKVKSALRVMFFNQFKEKVDNDILVQAIAEVLTVIDDITLVDYLSLEEQITYLAQDLYLSLCYKIEEILVLKLPCDVDTIQ